MYDYHLHSHVSFDGRDGIADIAAAAKDAGLGHICITDHLEIGYPAELADIDVAPFDASVYLREYKAAKAQITGIDISFGVEAGLMEGSLSETAQRIRDDGYDFVIASQHVIAGRDPYYGGFFEKYGVKAGQKLYLEELLRNITSFDEFDVVGHIGYVDKYLPQNGKNSGEPFTYDDFPELIDCILKSVIDRGKGIEINASNYYYKGAPNPHPSIIKRYSQLGGQALTIGSDSHTKERVGSYIREALKLAGDCGLEYVCTYKGRKPEFHKI